MAITTEDRDVLLARARAVPSDAWDAFEDVLRMFVEQAEGGGAVASPVRRDLGALAASVNERRLQEAAVEFRAHAFSTSQVMAALNVRTRQAVQRLRAQGRLLGMQIAGVYHYPRWQFEAGRIRPEVSQLLGAFREAGWISSPVAVDRIMRTPIADLDARTPEEALARGIPAQAVIDAILNVTDGH